MAEKKNTDGEKYLNLPVLTPEEEREIEEREAKLAAEQKAAAEEKTAEANKTGGAPAAAKRQSAASDAKDGKRVITADAPAAAPKDDLDVGAVAAAVLGGASPSPSEQTAADALKAAEEALANRPEEKTEVPEDEADASLITEVLSEKELQDQLASLDREALETVLSATDIFKTCILPNRTELQERILKTKSDIITGDHCRIEFGLYGEDIAVCECTQIYGDIVASGDLRIDNFCEIFGTVICNGDAFIGEGVKIHGKMTIGGNLDIADSVTIDKEYQTFGYISIRSPIPVVTYLIIYIFALLQLKGEKAAEKKLDSLIAGAQSTPLVLPPRTTMDLSYFSVQTPMDIGVDCRLHGNIRAASVKIKRDTTIFGGVHAAESVKIGVRDAIHGDVAAPSIRVGRGADVLGDLIGETVWLHEDAHVAGIIKATEGLSFGAGD